MDSPPSAPPLPPRTAVAWRVYLAVVVLLALGATLVGSPVPLFLFFLVGWSVLLGWLTFRAAASKLPLPLAWLLTTVLGYHALFGPAMLLHFVTHSATRTDDLALRIWPHIVHWIDSFE